jgi:hypothetical protein
MPDGLAHLLFVPSPHGYEIVERLSTDLAVGAEIDFDARRYVVAKIGPSPFPADARRCAYLQVRP